MMLRQKKLAKLKRRILVPLLKMDCVVISLLKQQNVLSAIFLNHRKHTIKIWDKCSVINEQSRIRFVF